MILWQYFLFAILGFMSSLVLFVDHNLTNMCFTRGCDVIRKSKHSRIMGFSNTILGLLAFGSLIFLFIWYPESFFIGPISAAGTIYSIYFIYIGIRYYQAQCPFCIIANTSMLMIFLIWLSQYLGG